MLKEFNLSEDAHCFVCGGANVHGLQLTWATEGNKTESEFYPTRTHQGWQGLVHGGILATLLDEAMTRLAWQCYGKSVTSEMTVRYISPARIGDRLVIRGEVGAQKKRLLLTKAEICTGGGRLIATATGKAIVTP